MSWSSRLFLPCRSARLVWCCGHSRRRTGPLLPLDPDAVRYVPHAAHLEKVAEVLLRKVASTELRKQGDLLELAVTLADDPTVIGDVLLALQSVEHQTLEVGHIFARRLAGAATRRRRSAPWSTWRSARSGLGGSSPASTPATARPPRCWSVSNARGTPGRERVVQGRADERAGYGLLSREWPPDRGEGAVVTASARPARPWVRQENPSASTTASDGQRLPAAGRARRSSPRPRSAPAPPRAGQPAAAADGRDLRTAGVQQSAASVAQPRTEAW